MKTGNWSLKIIVVLCMFMNDSSVVQTNDEEIKNLLRKTIDKKRKTLLKVSEKTELLRMSLEKIEEEYNYRVGRLYVKDNLLDLEIIRNKKINELMDCGLSFEDAVLELEENLQREKERLQKEEEKFDEYYEIRDEKTDQPEDFLKTLRVLWKKLVHKYHPDLITDTTEKKTREDLMKKINKAYSENDLETLESISEKELIDTPYESTVAALEKIIIDIENAIVRSDASYKDLKKSQWHAYLRKPQKEKELLFKEMERNILSDIIKKQLILDALKKKHNNL